MARGPAEADPANSNPTAVTISERRYMRYLLLELETNGPFEMWDRLIWINSLLPGELTVPVTPLMRCHEVIIDLRPAP